MGIAEIITGIKATWAAAGAAIDTRDAVKLNEIKLAMSNQLLELYTAAFTLVETNAEQSARCRQLEEKLMQLEQKADERAKYELAEPHRGTFVYRLKEQNAATEPPHYLCPACFDKAGNKSILQISGQNGETGRCMQCAQIYDMAQAPPLHIGRSAF